MSGRAEKFFVPFEALLKAGDEKGLSLRLMRMKQKLEGKGVFA